MKMMMEEKNSFMDVFTDLHKQIMDGNHVFAKPVKYIGEDVERMENLLRFTNSKCRKAYIVVGMAGNGSIATVEVPKEKLVEILSYHHDHGCEYINSTMGCVDGECTLILALRFTNNRYGNLSKRVNRDLANLLSA